MSTARGIDTTYVKSTRRRQRRCIVYSPGVYGILVYDSGRLWTFSGNDGGQSQTPLAFGPRGTLFGTTTVGGKYDNGTVLELTQ